MDRLREILSGFPYGEEVAEMVRAAYPSGVTFGQGFRALLERLLAGRGLLFVDPLDESVRRLAAPLLRKAVQHDEGLHAKLIERGKELEAAGYHAQVHVEAKTSLVFLLERERRARLRRQNDEYASKERKYSAAELMDRAEQLSPNALLRPVVQDYVLPTVAYVGGPAELAYMAQSQVLYRRAIGADAGDGVARRIYVAGRAHGEVDGALSAVRPRIFPWRGRRAQRNRRDSGAASADC